MKVSLTVNGKDVTADVEDRTLLVHFLRDTADLTATNIGCETTSCGACTVLLDGEPVRSCLMYAVQAEGCEVTTIEGLSKPDGTPGALQEAFCEAHALQCGYCTPGMLVTARDIVLRLPDADEPRVRRELSGNLCRCTGYMGIVAAILRVLGERKGA